MKTIKLLFLVVASIFCALTAKAQESHNYFTTEVYPGLYSRIIFGNDHILFSYPPNQYVRLNYSGTKNGYTYYTYNGFTVAVTQNGSAISTISNGNVVRFNYVGPTSAYTGTNAQGSSTRSRQNSVTGRQHKCHFCNGTGKVTKNDSRPQYSTNDYYVYKTCSECGEKYNDTFVHHYHISCSNCYGKGYIEQ